MGGGERAFPSTSLSLALGAPDPTGERARHHLERLATAYWKPVYYYIRRAWSKSDADAKDLTQSFLVHVVETDLLSRFDTRRGNFRNFLKMCLRTFLAGESRTASRIKRGGDRSVLSLDDSEGLALPEPEAPAEEAFERDWTREVLDRALRDVEAGLRSEDKGIWFDAFLLFAKSQDSPAPLTYGEVAARLAISESDVRNHLRFVRRALRQRVIEVIGEYIVDKEDAVAEVKAILGEG